MAGDVKRSPWGAAAFAATLLILFFLSADRLGWFAPGPVLQHLEIGGNIDATGEAYVFRVSGTKTTDDTLRSRAASWIFSDGTAMAVALEGDAPPQIRQAGDRFVSQPYTARIPNAARTDAGAVLRVCFVYDPGMSCVQKAFTDMEALP